MYSKVVAFQRPFVSHRNNLGFHRNIHLQFDCSSEVLEVLGYIVAVAVFDSLDCIAPDRGPKVFGQPSRFRSRAVFPDGVCGER